MASTSIEWTDRTWNPIRGCSRVSEGCRNCYAEAIAARFSNPGNTFHGFAERTPEGPRWTGDVVLLRDRLTEPFAWKKPERVFVNSMSDLFHENLPDDAIDQVFAVMALTPQHTYQVLTKRAERMRSYCQKFAREYRLQGPRGETLVGVAPMSNVWLGVSVEDQQRADERIPLLLSTPAAVRFISAEPLLGPVDLTAVSLPQVHNDQGELVPSPRLDWVIVGGESGPGARPFDLAWARQIVQQCKSAGVPVFVKQLGAHVRGDTTGCLLDWRELPDGEWRRLPALVTPGMEAWVAEARAKTIGGRLFDRKGGSIVEWPSDLRVREFPGMSL